MSTHRSRNFSQRTLLLGEFEASEAAIIALLRRMRLASSSCDSNSRRVAISAPQNRNFYNYDDTDVAKVYLLVAAPD